MESRAYGRLVAGAEHRDAHFDETADAARQVARVGEREPLMQERVLLLLVHAPDIELRAHTIEHCAIAFSASTSGRDTLKLPTNASARISFAS